LGTDNPQYFSYFLTCTDFLVSGEEFKLLYDRNKDMLVTAPQPSAEELPQYYQSEDYISHTDSKKSIIDRLYQVVKAIMLKRKIRLLETFYPQKGNILDIGAGTGDFLKAAQKSGWKIHGVEPNEKARKVAENKNISLNKDSEKFHEGQFEVITLWHVLEHIPDLKNQIAELERLLKKDGVLIIAVPNFKSHDAKYYKEFWAAYDVPRHLWHFSKNAIEILFGAAGFELIKTLPLKFDSYYVSLLSEKNKSGKSNFLKAFQIGWMSNLKAYSSGEYSSLIYILKKKASK